MTGTNGIAGSIEPGRSPVAQLIRRELSPDGTFAGLGPGEPRRLRLLSLDDCAAAPPRGYILKGLIAPGDLAVLFGPPGAGKSVLAPYLAHGIAAGRGLFGRRVRRGPVLYVAAEDGAGMKPRAHALRRLHGDTAGLFIHAEGIDLQSDGIEDPPDLAALIAAAKRVGAVLIVLDTLARAFPGLDENDGRSMGRAVRVLRALCGDQRAVLVVHHGAKVGSSGGTGGGTPRGHGVLNGDADLTMRIEPPEEGTGPHRVILGKNRNGSSLAGFAFTIRGETLGVDDDGDPITAPVTVEAEGAGTGNKAPPLPMQARRALDYLADLLSRSGNMLPGGRMFPTSPELRCVPFEAWRAECASRTLSASEGKRAQNLAFQRAAEALIGRAFIATAEHAGTRLVWLAKGAGT